MQCKYHWCLVWKRDSTVFYNAIFTIWTKRESRSRLLFWIICASRPAFVVHTWISQHHLEATGNGTDAFNFNVWNFCSFTDRKNDFTTPGDTPLKISNVMFHWWPVSWQIFSSGARIEARRFGGRSWRAVDSSYGNTTCSNMYKWSQSKALCKLCKLCILHFAKALVPSTGFHRVPCSKVLEKNVICRAKNIGCKKCMWSPWRSPSINNPWDPCACSLQPPLNLLKISDSDVLLAIGNENLDVRRGRSPGSETQFSDSNQTSSLVITCHHLSSLVITCHHLSSLVITCHHLSSLVITCHHLSSLVITCHHLSSLVITCHHLSSLVITCHHLSSLVITCHHLSSLVITCHHLSSLVQVPLKTVLPKKKDETNNKVLSNWPAISFVQEHFHRNTSLVQWFK